MQGFSTTRRVNMFFCGVAFPALIRLVLDSLASDEIERCEETKVTIPRQKTLNLSDLKEVPELTIVPARVTKSSSNLTNVLFLRGA